MNRLRNSWELVRASARVLQADKELIIFPILSSIGVLLVSVAFVLPMFFGGVFDSLVTGRMGDLRVAGLIITFLFYLVQYFVVIFSNAALVGAATIRLQGGDPTVSDGFRIAFGHLGPILGYSLIASTVGLILRSISSRSQTFGRAGGRHSRAGLEPGDFSGRPGAGDRRRGSHRGGQAERRAA